MTAFGGDITNSVAENQTTATLFAKAARQAVALARKHAPARALLPEGFKSDPFAFAAEQCMDKAVATVEFTEDGFRFVDGPKLTTTLDHRLFTKYDFDEKKGWGLGDDGLLIMVLESPHRHEFDAHLKPVAPAQKNTGRNIGNCMERQHRHMPGIECVASGRYRLVLMNAVQYQCSLGASPTSLFRDYVFREVWERFGRADFVERLGMYIAEVQNHLVMICCSKGKTVLPVQAELKELRDMVAEAAQGLVGEGRLFRRPHPSSGWFCRKFPLNR